MELAVIVVPVLGIALLASGVQSIAGMGFGLVATPVFVALFGPTEGVLWGNIIGLLTSGTLLVQKWRDIEWPIAIRFIIAAVPVIIGTVFFTQGVSRAWLNVGIGVLMLLLVAFSTFSPKMPPAKGIGPMYVTGAVGGFLSASVGQAGPAMTAYARAAEWPQKNFAATLQVYFLAMNLVNIPMKFHVGFGPEDATVGWATLIAGFIGIAIGTEIARRIAKRITPKQARNFAMIIAALGATWVLIQGIIELV